MDEMKLTQCIVHYSNLISTGFKILFCYSIEATTPFYSQCNILKFRKCLSD